MAPPNPDSDSQTNQPETDINPESLQRLAQEAEKVLGAHHPYVKSLLDDYQKAIIARQSAKDPEVKLIAARKRTHRIQLKIDKAQEDVRNKKAALQVASQEVDQAIERVKALKGELEEARKTHAEAASEVKAQPSGVVTAKDVLRVAGIDVPDNMPQSTAFLEGIQHQINAFQELLRQQKAQGEGGPPAPTPDADMTDSGDAQSSSKRTGGDGKGIAPTPKRGKTTDKKQQAGTPKSQAKGADLTPGGSCS